MSSSVPESRAQAIWRQLRELADGDGMVSFGQFMETALYGPHGYYQSGPKLGGRGADFFTATQFPLFGYTLGHYAAQLAQTWYPQAGSELCVIELGPGQGELAEAACTWLLEHLPPSMSLHYILVERSAALTQTQQQRLSAFSEAQSAGRLHLSWSTTVPHQVTDKAIVFANEVLDALPVERIRRTPDGWEQAFLQIPQGQLAGRAEEVWRPACPEIEAKAQAVDVPVGNETEICPGYEDLLADCRRCARTVHALWFDYGVTVEELAEGIRPRGTLRGFSRHQVVSPLEHPGDVDITSDVCWPLAESAAVSAGFGEVTRKSQGAFLMEAGITEVAQEWLGETQPFGPKERGRVTSTATLLNGMKTLVLPGGMGERFSVLICDSGDEDGGSVC